MQTQRLNPELIQVAIRSAELGVVSSIVASKNGDLPKVHLLAFGDSELDEISKVLSDAGIDIKNFEVKHSDFYQPR